MEEEMIKQQILNIPLEKWKDMCVELNGVKISAYCNGGGYNPVIYVDGVMFGGEKLSKLYYDLYEQEKKRKLISEQEKIHEIYTKLCGEKI